MIPGYRVQTAIGKGARSVIYHVVETKTGQSFILKRVVRESAADHRFLEQVEREFRVTSAIEHPNLRRSIALHRKRKWLRVSELLLIAEYVEGQTLEERLPDGLDELLAICGQVCQGLHALHQAGYVHADIKPHNILWSLEGVVKVIDFGQSCHMGHRKKRIQGTPDYIAPEQVRRMPLDQRTDIFNLGATMYWALTGRAYPTHLGSDAVGRRLAVVGPGSPKSPRELDESVPLALSTLVMDCCRTNPSDRPADMLQVSKRIEAAAAVLKRGRAPARPATASNGDPISRPAGGGSSHE
ncbi:MAG: serine/threonine protein kinase [Planctomycetes bacterium]|nr:serine/threonine protein kinase [Planctomycetota bacterium]